MIHLGGHFVTGLVEGDVLYRNMDEMLYFIFSWTLKSKVHKRIVRLRQDDFGLKEITFEGSCSNMYGTQPTDSVER
jgi:hypothetical protein